MNRKEIREEVVAQGAENILNAEGGEARLNRWIAQAIREICDYRPWPFLRATKEGTMPLTIGDLGHVLAVIDVAAKFQLDPISVGQALAGDPTQSTKGKAAFWYTEDGEILKVAPIDSSSTFKVLYRKVPGALTDVDVPIIPADYHDLIVDRVRVKVYKATDNYEAAREVLKEYERGLGEMEHALLHSNYDKERRLTRSGRAGDYL